MKGRIEDQVFISIDVEANGPIPGPYSMLSLGAAAFSLNAPRPEVPRRVFGINFQCLPGAEIGHPATMNFWKQNPKEFAATRENCETPDAGTQKFFRWLNECSPNSAQNLVMVAYPLGFDWQFVNYYLMQFAGANPLGLSGIDIKTLAWSKLGGAFRSINKRRMPRRWFGREVQSHLALDDAMEQGVLFVRLTKEISNEPRGQANLLALAGEPEERAQIVNVENSREVPVLS